MHVFVKTYSTHIDFVKLGSRSKVNLKSLIRDLDLELVAIIAMSPTISPHVPIKLFISPHVPYKFSEHNNIEISSCMNLLVN